MLKPLICVTLLFATDFVLGKPDYIFVNEVNGWLKLHVVPAKWQEAFINCHYEGAVLASPINPKLAAAMQNIMKRSNVDSSIYLGVTAFTPGDFMSIEGVPLADLSITWGSFSPGEPEDCLSLSKEGKTFISSCRLYLPYICYKKRDDTTVLNKCGTFDNEYKLNTATGSCYKQHKRSMSWADAHKICTAEGAYLLILNDKQEAHAIKKEYLSSPSKGNKGNATYVGIRNWYGDGTWLSIHGEKIENLYDKWAKGKPDSKDYFGCGLFWGHGTLENVFCRSPHSFICEKDPQNLRYEHISVPTSDVVYPGLVTKVP
ncbi:hypothetical protein PYW07_011452 [Mythimna separata]|uniref:C-type lectin domain-containing protein n=1 Tax=Mythimna separata TaxID=271217 RepID=A0AAD8DLZ9_MYTSE|nr:hypothetical protein PYW07_011452 [Mythimna separata]